VTGKRELNRQVEEMKRQMADDEQATFELTQDMTRQYKGMQEELLSRVSATMENGQLRKQSCAALGAYSERVWFRALS
jgi:hypothetical protein